MILTKIRLRELRSRLREQSTLRMDIFFSRGAFPYLQGEYIRDILRARCPVPIAVENDANSAAIAELRSGALCGVEDAVAVILGSSIGGAIIRNGEVCYGKHFSAAEFSLIKVDSGDDSLHHLWRNISGKNGLLRLVQQSMKTEDVFDGIEIFDMANNGNRDVLKSALTVSTTEDKGIHQKGGTTLTYGIRCCRSRERSRSEKLWEMSLIIKEASSNTAAGGPFWIEG